MVLAMNTSSVMFSGIYTVNTVQLCWCAGCLFLFCFCMSFMFYVLSCFVCDRVHRNTSIKWLKETVGGDKDGNNSLIFRNNGIMNEKTEKAMRKIVPSPVEPKIQLQLKPSQAIINEYLNNNSNKQTGNDHGSSSYLGWNSYRSSGTMQMFIKTSVSPI